MKANDLPKNFRNKAVIEKELSTANYIPFSSHVTKTIIKNKSGDYLSCISMEGIAHETADIGDINIWHQNLNTALRNIASPNLAIWTHIVRSSIDKYPGGVFRDKFTRELDRRYREKCVGDKNLRVNGLYLTIIYRPITASTAKKISKVARLNPEQLRIQQLKAIEAIEDATKTVLSLIRRYSPKLLSCYVEGETYFDLDADLDDQQINNQVILPEKSKVYFSELLEFYGSLINNEKQKFAIPRTSIDNYIVTARPNFFHNTWATQNILGHTKYGAILTIKEYPEFTGPGILDQLLTANFDFVLTQSFTFISKPKSLEMLQQQQRRMVNAGDLAQTQVEAIDDGLDDITSNKFVMGNYHFSLNIISDDSEELDNNLGQARTILSDTSMVMAREDIGIEAAYWAQLPGNFEYRPRPAPINSKNFSGFSAFHNYPMGRPDRNHWGPAVALLKTDSGAPYYFNFHRNSLGNTLITGPSGSGKTVTQAFLLAQLDKFDPQGVFYDKDRGAEIFIRSKRGSYFPLRIGEKTGWNPLQLEPNSKNLTFIDSLLRRIAKPSNRKLTVSEERDLSKAIDGLMHLPRDQRRLSNLLQFLDPTQQDGIYYTLQQWTVGHKFGWVFDNEKDTLDFNSNKLFGFDMTEILDSDDVRTSALYYLLFRQDEVIDGRRFCCFMDEFWRLLLDDIFIEFAQDKLKVIRKQNGFLVFGTQSAKDTLKSPIAHTIIEQCPTQIFMPNQKADYADYVTGFGLSDREYEIIKTLSEDSRKFLIKQGHNSVVVQLDLAGFDDELAILSGTTANANLVNEIIQEVGEDPDIWIPIFHKRRKSA